MQARREVLGYDFHITRASDWTEAEVAPITSEEWLAYVETDPELRLAVANGRYFALWAGKSDYPEPWFDWARGRVHTKNPDSPLIEKAIQIAVQLGARVLGDDGERYLPDGRVERDGAVDISPGMDWRKWKWLRLAGRADGGLHIAGPLNAVAKSPNSSARLSRRRYLLTFRSSGRLNEACEATMRVCAT